MIKLKDKIISWLIAKINIGKFDKTISRIPLINVIYKFFAQKTINYDFPAHLFIEPTNACNFRCKMCVRTNGNNPIGNMDFALFKKIVDEAKQYGPRSFSLHLFGEPLMAPKIVEMIKYIKESNPRNAVLLTTNGTLLTSEKSEALIKYRLDKIFISFTSPDKRTYFEKTGADKLKEAEENVERLITAKKNNKSKKPLIFARMIVEKETEGQIKEFLKRWKEKDVILEIRDMHNYGGNIEKSHVRKNKKRHPCYHLWFSPSIHWNGDVSACCNDYGRELLLGNIKKQTLNEIWNGAQIRYYRNLHLAGKYDPVPICQDCDVWNIYSDLFFWWQKK